MIGQYVTLTEARLMVEILRANGMPVAPENSADDYHNETSGIWLDQWVNAGNQPEPSIGDAREYKYRLKNGFGGDIGLIFMVAYGQASQGQAPRFDIAVRRESAWYKDWLALNPDQADKA